MTTGKQLAHLLLQPIFQLWLHSKTVSCILAICKRGLLPILMTTWCCLCVSSTQQKN
jgi:hypothetical protein